VTGGGVTRARPNVSILIPAYNAEATLPACLEGIARSTWQPLEVILFSDGSTDSTEAIATAAGCRIVRNDGRPRGPAHGRNEAAKAAVGDWLLLVDADVVIAPDALELLGEEMLAKGAIGAFGSYDDTPRSQRGTSLYANLRHHFVHQHGPADASTFWSGLGLIDRETFLRFGGFDEALFPYPSIEDVELGARLVAAGHRIRLVHAAHGKHCKDWPLLRVWHTDIFRRAVPWAEMIIDGKTAGADLNVSQIERIKALVALLGLALLLGSVIVPQFLIGVVATWLAYIWFNRDFFGFLAKRLPLHRLALAVTMHWCYHIYSTFTFVIIAVTRRLGWRRRIAVPE